MNHRKIKIGLVQVNNSFANQHYLPYSVGLLQGYAQHYISDRDKFEFLLPIYSRIPVQKAVAQFMSADLVCFSTYVWNMQISLMIASRLKKIKHRVVIVFGGPQVSDRDKDFLRRHPFIDLTLHGEGERSFLRLLESFDKKDWINVPSARFINEKGHMVETPRLPRIPDLDTIPSPFLNGTFEPLFEAYPDIEWLGLWETNRGCPFSCTYCDWGAAIQTKVDTFSMDRLRKEIVWFSSHKVKFIFCCDANFGLLPRDIEIAKFTAEIKRKTSCPEVLSVQNTKNSTEVSYAIQKILGSAGLNKAVTLSVQSLNRKALRNIGRQNIKLDVYQELQKRFAADQVETYSDFILGLPGETYESFKDGVSILINNGQHCRIQFNNLSILPNAGINDPIYRQRHGIVSVHSKIINMHGSLNEADEVYEIQELVVGTKTMPREDWVKVRAFAWMVSFLYFDKVLQIPIALISQVGEIQPREIFEIFMAEDVSSEILHDIRDFFFERARHIQNGGEEYCESKKWLNIWWPSDEYMLIKLCCEEKIEDFYQASAHELKKFIHCKGLTFPDEAIDAAVQLNFAALKRPVKFKNGLVEARYNVYECYRSAIKGEHTPLIKGLFRYKIEGGKIPWPSTEDWCKEVIWYGNKNGAYLFPCSSIGEVDGDDKIKLATAERRKT